MERKDYFYEITSVAEYIADLIRNLPTTAIPLKYTTWTIGTAAAHLVISQRYSKKILQGEKNPYKNADPEIVADTNAKLLEEFNERKGDKLATMLVMDTEAFIKTTAVHQDSKKIHTHFGDMDMLTALSYNLYHLLIHGSQIAKALHKQLPVEEKHIPMILPFLKKAMMVTYDKDAAKDFHGTFGIRLKHIPEFSVICNGPNIKVEEQRLQQIDCHITADPITFFLLSAGIQNHWQAILQRKIFVWGRKPWLALRFTNLFKSP